MMSTSKSDDEFVDENLIASKGIILLINNETLQAEELFRKHKDYSPLLSSCYSFIKILLAFLTLDESKLDEALSCVKQTLQFCEPDNSFENFKNRIFKQNVNISVTIDQIQRRIIMADCQLYIGLLNFVKQDIPGCEAGFF